LQRKLTTYRTLYFTISVEDDRAEIYGSLSALGSSNSGLNLMVVGENGKPPSLGKIVNLLAHDILRRYYLSKDPNHKLASLTDEEFEDLSSVLVGAESANRRTASGRHNPEDYSKLIPTISGLVNTAPNWPELVYLAAWIADSGEDTKNAIKYYEQVRPQFAQMSSNEVVQRIVDRVKFLTDILTTASNKTAVSVSVSPSTATTSLEKLPPSIDYSSLVKIKDMGPEGSSVGQALATALEVKLANNNVDKRISARFIYYAARKIEGTESTDSGAQIQDGFNVLLKEGAVKENIWPYVAGKFAESPPPAVAKAERFRIAGWRKVRNLPDMNRALVEGPPVVAGITIFKEMLEVEAARTGIVPVPAKGSQILGGHAVVVVGYDDKAQLLKFANSWGTGWGDRGFGYLPYGYITDDRVDAWAFTLP
jgi:C1A family cysteine protease